MKKVQFDSQEGRFQPRRGKSSALLCKKYRDTFVKPSRCFLQSIEILYLAARQIGP